MNIIHLKSASMDSNQWDQIKLLNEQIIRTSLYDQALFQGGCLESTCTNGIEKAKANSTTEILLGYVEHQLISYMIFYTDNNPPTLQSRLDNYKHLGKVCYSEMLVVDPKFQRRGHAKEMRSVMKSIARKANVDAFMAFVRTSPIPNLPSLHSLRKAGAVCGKYDLIIGRDLEQNGKIINDICLEMLYPTDYRTLGTDPKGNIKWM